MMSTPSSRRTTKLINRYISPLLALALMLGGWSCKTQEKSQRNESGGSAQSAENEASGDEPPGNETPAPDGVDPHRTPAPTMGVLGASWLVRDERIEEEEPEKMLNSLGIEEGMVVADIGAGAGYHTSRLMERVGPNGKVYATDIQQGMLDLIEDTIDDREDLSSDNLELVLAGQTETGLPSNAIDLALLVDVYHELSEPEEWLEDMARALKPDGRLVLIEFRANDPDVPIKPEHTMTREQAEWELEQQSWELIEYHDILDWQHIMIFQYRPQGQATENTTDKDETGDIP